MKEKERKGKEQKRKKCAYDLCAPWRVALQNELQLIASYHITYKRSWKMVTERRWTEVSKGTDVMSGSSSSPGVFLAMKCDSDGCLMMILMYFRHLGESRVIKPSSSCSMPPTNNRYASQCSSCAPIFLQIFVIHLLQVLETILALGLCKRIYDWKSAKEQGRDKVLHQLPFGWAH